MVAYAHVRQEGYNVVNRSLQLPITIYQFTNNKELFITFPSMKIENCKMKIASEGGV